MGIKEHVTHFAGLPVVEWDVQCGIRDPIHALYRIGLSYKDAEHMHWGEKFRLFLDNPMVDRITGIVIGDWHSLNATDGAESVIAALAAASERLSHLRAIFLGDIVEEEYPIGWIEQTDISPLFREYPLLQEMCIRGSEGLRLGSVCHAQLRSLTIQSSGLSPAVVRDVVRAELPALRRLELWLGDAVSDVDGENEVMPGDFEPIFTGDLLPNIQHLGLRNSEIADDIAATVAEAPVLERIRVIDLSLGTLSNTGAAYLLTSPSVARLKKLDIHHHYCSQEMVEQLEGLNISVDASNRQDARKKGGPTVAFSQYTW